MVRRLLLWRLAYACALAVLCVVQMKHEQHANPQVPTYTHEAHRSTTSFQ